jgi:phosphatidate phosphatase APP1
MITFFPTYAQWIEAIGVWRVNIHGMVTQPLPVASRRRTVAYAVVKRLLKLDEGQLRSPIFQARSETFLFQRISGQSVQITLGGKLIDVGISKRTGHFEINFDLDAQAVSESVVETPYGQKLCFESVDEDLDSRPVTTSGAVQLIHPSGISIISDIDDTVKFTNVADRRELLANTLLREFVPIPDMVDLYKRWSLSGAAFHYVSASPWQLTKPLNEFFHSAGLPDGSMHLKLFRLKDSTPLGRMRSSKKSKQDVIIEIIDHFPNRKFILVGDSGERDPEVYAKVAQQRRTQIAGVAIRRVPSRRSKQKVESALKILAHAVPSDGLRVFTTADEISDLLSAKEQP